MRFVWDENKNKHNYKYHGIKFEDAILVFNDPRRLDIYDSSHSDDEDRYITIGQARRILFVVYTERKSYIRLISARPATTSEEDMYYAGDLYT